MMLLSLDDPMGCWELALDFLRIQLDVERVDGGNASPTDLIYRPGATEVVADAEIQSIHGLVVNNQSSPAQHIWQSNHPLVHPDILQDTIFDLHLRRYFASAGTVAKMTSAISYNDAPIGLVCADQINHSRSWKSTQYDCFESVTHDVMAPVLFFAVGLAPKVHVGLTEDVKGEGMPALTAKWASLSKAEKQVAQLVAAGLSYKEIAARTHRSFSTVDHHLRSIREKLRVRTTAKLVSLLADVDLWQ
jgi:DNA-binding CsgD family transcriptional regulator